MGQWRNGGIARKTIARGIDVTILDRNLEAKHVREQRSNDTRCTVLFSAACLFDIVHFGCSLADECVIQTSAAARMPRIPALFLSIVHVKALFHENLAGIMRHLRVGAVHTDHWEGSARAFPRVEGR